MTDKRRYGWISDAGHAWLKVPREDLDRSGAAQQISFYSYQHDGFVYLEEDCDAGRFLDALKAHLIPFELFEEQDVDHWHGRDAYQSYSFL